VSANSSKILRNSITFLAASLSSATIAWADETTRFEMWEEPSHQQVFVDGPARILDIRIVPGLMSEFHKHRFATAYVYGTRNGPRPDHETFEKQVQRSTIPAMSRSPSITVSGMRMKKRFIWLRSSMSAH
jgi:hypothetical protein